MAAKDYEIVFKDPDGKPLPTRICIVEASAKLDIQAAADKPKTFSGVAYSGGALNVAGFKYPVYADLRGMRIVRQDNAALRAHKQEMAVGHTTLVAIADNTLRVEGVISREGVHVDELLASARNKFPWQPSIGTTIEQLELVAAGESATVNGRSVSGPAYIARRTTFREVSFVEVGGDADATITLAASLIDLAAFNENHGPDGRFTDGAGGGGSGSSGGAGSASSSASAKASQYSKEASTASSSATTKGLTSKENDASQSAQKATDKASASGTKASHEAAAQEHDKAGKLHDAAANHWSGSSAPAAAQLKAQHTEAAARHRGAAILHRVAGGLSASAGNLGDGSMAKTFEDYAAERGSDLAKLTAPQRTALKASFDAEIKAFGGVNHTNDIADLVAQAVKQAVGQVGETMALQAQLVKHPDLAKLAVDEKWEPTQIQAALKLAEIRNARPTGFSVSGGEQADLTPKVLEAALCQYANLPDAMLTKGFDEKTLNLAHEKFRRTGIQSVLIRAAGMNGYSVRGDGTDVRSDLPGILRAAFSTTSLGNILSNVANKFLLAGYSAVEQSWRKIARVRPVKDFKQTTAYRLTGSGVWSEIGPDGELKHGTLADQSFTNQAKTYGQMLSIPRPDIINDDLNALTDVPRILGRGGALKLNLVFWAAWLNDSAFFKAGNNNYISGGTTNLSSTSLATMRKTFRAQTDADGNPLGAEPKFLLVGETNETTALELMNSEMIGAGGDTSVGKFPTKNTFKDAYDLVVSTYLENANVTGNSTTGFYLVADPADGAAIEVVFLDGNEIPTVEQADADFSQLGIQMRAFHDFGINLQDFRYAVKSKGAA